MFNITENKLALRNGTNLDNSAMSSTGMSSVIKPSQDPMRNTTNSSKSYQRPT